MRPTIRLRRLLLPILAAAPLAVVAIGCTAEPTKVVTETLVAPPGMPAVHNRGKTHVIVNLEAIEQTAEVAPGVTYTQWTFNGTVPGPMIRARVGDTVEVRLKNSAKNTSTHNIDLHSVNGPGGGAGATTVAPGEEKAFEFLAKAPGLFAYHCAAGIVADHIANGMFGGILIEPAATTLPLVDHEFYIGQSEFYTIGSTGAKGQQDLDFAKLMNEDPAYVVFNGNTKSLIGDKALQAKVGETVRLYFVNGGPNLISSFHVIGEIFDRAWDYGTLSSPPLQDVQTILVPPGGATITQFKVEVPGDYKLVDHAISRVSKGAVGTLHVEGPADPKTFGSTSGVTGSAATGHDMSATPGAQATPAPTKAAAAGTSAPTAGSLQVSMKDNLFAQTSYAATAGQTAKFDLSNDGKLPHNMRIAQADGSFDGPQSVVSDPEILSAGKTGTLTFTPATAGTYKFRCDIHPDQMTGTIKVQ